MLPGDRKYFEHRAEQELARARTASHENVARAHYIMAGHYLDIVHNGFESWSAACGFGGRELVA